MKKVSLLSFYLIATVAIFSSGNNTFLNTNHSQSSFLPTEKASDIGGSTGTPTTNPPRP